MTHKTSFGAFPSEKGTHFSVWAPSVDSLHVVLFDKDQKETSKHALTKDTDGIWQGDVQEAKTGSLYKYLVGESGPFPDPASRFQPQGVHGPSEVVDPSTFKWTDQAWKGIDSLDKLTIYELHVGTFTKEGTYKALEDKLQYLKDLGVNTLEILPLADFPGRWNWGYDGVALYAPTRAYGRPDELRSLVNAAHNLGLSVLIDLVYNHLGPDGNYLSCYNPRYFTKKYDTPWGAALNYDPSVKVHKQEGEEETKEVSKDESAKDAHDAPQVRKYVVENGLYFMRDFHFDGARLDATHAIIDYSTPHVLQELVRTCKEGVNRPIYFFAEDDRNEAELISKPNGLDALWADDFHHQVRVQTNGDNESYFANFTGSIEDLATTLRKGWFYTGQVAPASGEKRGTDPSNLDRHSHSCYCIQNHDQIGNRALGERLHHEIKLDEYKVASALLLLAPAVPMLFQGQEWATTSPFQFFTDHNADLGKLVTEGRRKEFGKFKAFSDPSVREKIPDPQAESTFQNSKVNWEETNKGDHAAVLALYKDLLKLRTAEPALHNAKRADLEVHAVSERVLAFTRKNGGSTFVAVFQFKAGDSKVDLTKFGGASKFEVVFNSQDQKYATSDNKTQAATLEGTTLHFTGASAVVLRAQ